MVSSTFWFNLKPPSNMTWPSTGDHGLWGEGARSVARLSPFGNVGQESQKRTWFQVVCWAEVRERAAHVANIRIVELQKKCSHFSELTLDTQDLNQTLKNRFLTTTDCVALRCIFIARQPSLTQWLPIANKPVESNKMESTCQLSISSMSSVQWKDPSNLPSQIDQLLLSLSAV